MPENSEPMSKIALLFEDGDLDTATLDKRFEWKVLEDSQWEFTNGIHYARGHFITPIYSGAHKGNPADHSLNLGDVVGIKQGRCWRVQATRLPLSFDCYGIALGWYEDNDAALVIISGRINGFKELWVPGDRMYLPFYGFGVPCQTKRQRSDGFCIGIAVGKTDMILTPRIDI